MNYFEATLGDITEAGSTPREAAGNVLIKHLQRTGTPVAIRYNMRDEVTNQYVNMLGIEPVIR